MIFRRKRKQKINEEFVTENAEKIGKEDVEKVVRESSKIKSKLETNSRFEKFIDEGKTMLSLIKDYWKKDYTKIPWYALTAIVFTLLYVLNPMDLSPDYIPFVGYIDDVSVFSFALTLVNKDLTAYKEWKELHLED
ncbi:DUF1232 domain-containing protein [bacterium SCSIO 12643]|nr:DUF1232 domain-containing protein [bacterium SCSIO 12643]